MRACFATGPYGAQPPALELPNATPRYASGPATFFRCKYEPWRETAADIAIVGVPFHGGVTNRPGARHGPRRVREASADHVRPLARGRSPLELAACVDGGDVAVQRPYELEGAHGEIEAAFRAATLRDVATLAVGGDHSVTLPILRGLVDARGGEPLGLVHLDAHCDTGDDYLGSRFHPGQEKGDSMSRKTTEIGAFEVGNFAPFSCPGSTTARPSRSPSTRGCWTRSAASSSGSGARWPRRTPGRFRRRRA
jgi:hypothetical protein